jgi:hypothetical protein
MLWNRCPLVRRKNDRITTTSPSKRLVSLSLESDGPKKGRGLPQEKGGFNHLAKTTSVTSIKTLTVLMATTWLCASTSDSSKRPQIFRVKSMPAHPNRLSAPLVEQSHHAACYPRKFWSSRDTKTSFVRSSSNQVAIVTDSLIEHQHSLSYHIINRSLPLLESTAATWRIGQLTSSADMQDGIAA